MVPKKSILGCGFDSSSDGDYRLSIGDCFQFDSEDIKIGSEREREQSSSRQRHQLILSSSKLKEGVVSGGDGRNSGNSCLMLKAKRAKGVPTVAPRRLQQSQGSSVTSVIGWVIRF